MGCVDALPHAVFVLDSRGALLSSNSRGERLLRDQDGLRLTAHKFQLDPHGDNARFEQLVSACRSRFEPGAMQVRRPSGKLPYILSVMQVAPEACALAAQASVLVTVQDPSTREIRRIETLVQVFGFTRAEAALAGALASGHSLTSAAHAHGISLATARVHLKSVFRKARVNRQADLVRLLSSVSPLDPAG